MASLTSVGDADFIKIGSDNMLQLHTMKMRLISIIIVISLATTICISGIFIYNSIADNEQRIEDYRSELQQSIEAKLMSEVETAKAVAEKYYRREQNGELTRQQAMKKCRDGRRIDTNTFKTHAGIYGSDQDFCSEDRIDK